MSGMQTIKLVLGISLFNYNIPTYTGYINMKSAPIQNVKNKN